MKRIKLLDCTLRDGGYLVNKVFPQDLFQSVISSICASGIEEAEIGFLQNEQVGRSSNAFISNADVFRMIDGTYPDLKLTLLMDLRRYDISNLDKCDAGPIDKIRVCFYRHEISQLRPVCEIIKDAGYELSLQPIDTFDYSKSDIKTITEVANTVMPQAFSLVDTFGSVYPDDAIITMKAFDALLDSRIALGIHSHNNIHMSVALSLAMIKSVLNRELVLDGSIGGFGRGAGNAPIEILADYLNRYYGGEYSISALIDGAEFLDKLDHDTFGYDLRMFSAGYTHSHINTVNFLIGNKHLSINQAISVMESADKNTKERYDYKKLDSICESVATDCGKPQN